MQAALAAAAADYERHTRVAQKASATAAAAKKQPMAEPLDLDIDEKVDPKGSGAGGRKNTAQKVPP